MDGILKLNEYQVLSNAPAGSHDPSMMWDPVSKKYYSYATDVDGTKLGVKEKIGIPVKSSEDLVRFKYEGIVLSEQAIEQGRDNGPDYARTINFWAPFVEYVHGEYRMYYSATRAFGSSESRIWLAVADHPLGPFENRGVVADTWGTDDTYPNAIDPHIIRDETGDYLIYGSFFGGIYIKELNPSTGLPVDGNPKNLGTCIARKSDPPVIDGPEGPSAIYVPETGWYYLFISYGWLGNDYDIRVGRSKKVTGPYLDRQGRNLKMEALGEKLANSYRFESSNPRIGSDAADWAWGGFRGPGHGVPFFDPVREKYFFVHHIRDGSPSNQERDPYLGRESYRLHYMMIRPMFFRDGWPVLGPEPYTGESLEPISPIGLKGLWELIILDDKNNGPKCSEIYDLTENCDILSKSVLYQCWDFENQKRTVGLTGALEDGTAIWGKKLSE